MSQAGLDSWPTNYEQLKDVFEHSQMICDPVDYAHRQQRLLKCLAMYLIERDKPKEEKNEV